MLLKPNDKLDVRDLNVPQDEVIFVENKVGAKHTGKVEIVHTKSELLARDTIRKQQEELDVGEKKLSEERKAFDKEKAEFEKAKTKK